MFNTLVLNDGYFVSQGRVALPRNAVLAPLNAEESTRIASYWGIAPPEWRLEIHDVASAAAAEKSVHDFFALLSLVVRVAPRWESIALDRWDGSRWVRQSYSSAGGGARGAVSHIPLKRLTTLRGLLSNGPLTLPKSLAIALGFITNP